MKSAACLVLLVAGVLVLVPAAFSQEGEEAKGPKMDELSAKLIDGWTKKEYHPGRLGVRKATCKARMSSQGMAAGFTYTWDGEKGVVEWDDSQAAAMFQRGGRMSEMFDTHFDAEYYMKAFGSATLTGKETEEGAVITIEGETESGLKELSFNKEGILVGATIARNHPQMGNFTMKTKFTQEKVGEHYLFTGDTAEMDVAGAGKVETTTTRTYEEVSGFRLVKKVEMSMTMGGMQMGGYVLEVSSWEVE